MHSHDFSQKFEMKSLQFSLEHSRQKNLHLYISILNRFTYIQAYMVPIENHFEINISVIRRIEWLSTVGSPGCQIERCELSNWKTLARLDYKDFSIRF